MALHKRPNSKFWLMNFQFGGHCPFVKILAKD
jgi:hypothetical protein